MVYLVSDWNGTIFKYPKDDVQNKALAVAAIKTDFFHFRWGSVAHLIKTKKVLEQMLEEYRAGKRPLKDLYDTFNREYLRGRDPEFVESAIEKYALKSADKVDRRVLEAIRNAMIEHAKKGILSVSYDYSVRRILALSGYPAFFDNENIVANALEVGGDRKVVGITLGIYGRKPEVMADEFFRKRKFPDKQTVYLGDDHDDEGIAEMLPEGNFVVPFFASEEFREEMARKHKAFVPESEEDLRDFLKSK